MKNLCLLLASALSAVGFMACTDEADAPQPMESGNNEIRFAASTDLSRVTDITTNNLKSFNVYAYTTTPDSANLFMDNVTVRKTSNNVWTYSPVQYWPANKDVDFYAYAPEQWVGSKSPLQPIPYYAYPGHEDLVYAVNMNLRGNVGQPNAQVIFNFRHALSKVTVKMSSTNTNLKVMITNVALSNLYSKGNFNFPQESTKGEPTAQSIGTWTDQNSPVAYVLHWSQALEDHFQLTTTPTIIVEQGVGLGGSLFLIPQPLTYRSNGSGMDNYISVMCSIYDAKTDTKLWPNENTPPENIVSGSTYGDGLLKFPLSTSKFSEWQPGYHYIYNLVINSNEEMGSIEFGTPTVDTFVEVESNYE